MMVQCLGFSSSLLASLILSTAIVWSEFQTDLVHHRAVSIPSVSLHDHSKSHDTVILGSHNCFKSSKCRGREQRDVMEEQCEYQKILQYNNQLSSSSLTISNPHDHAKKVSKSSVN